MRASIAGAIVAASALIEPVAPARYVVIPTAIGSHQSVPCRPSLSEDGRVVAFEADSALHATDRNGTTDVYVVDRQHQTITLASRAWHGAAGQGASRCPSLARDGHRVVFESDALDLVQGDDADTTNVFSFDLAAGRVVRLSQWPDDRIAWSTGGVISADGRHAVFQSRRVDSGAASPTRVFRVDVEGLGPIEDLGKGFRPTVSQDGRTVAHLSTEGSRVARAHARTGQDVREVGAGRSGAADAAIEELALSADGQWVTYVSRATNLLPGRRLSGRRHVYLEHVTDRTRVLISADRAGREANGYSRQPSVDGTATRVVFESSATNLGCGEPDATCAADLNLVTDIFSWERATGRIARVNVAAPSLPWLGASTASALSFNGQVTAFFSCQPVTDEDDRGTFDLFLTGPRAVEHPATPTRRR